MSELVTAIFETFTTTMTGLANGLSDAFLQILYNEGTAESGFNPLIIFIFTVAGISLAAAILWRMFAMIRGASHSAQ